MDSDNEFISSDLPYHLSTRYKIDQWVEPYPKNGALCVFNSLNNAIRFIRRNNSIYDSNSRIRLFECEYIPTRKRIFIYFDENCGYASRINTRLYANSIPRGTRKASHVMIKKNISCEISKILGR